MINLSLAKLWVVALLAAIGASPVLAVPFEATKTARSNTSTIQTESNSATDRKFSPIDATGIDKKFPNNPLLSQRQKRCELLRGFSNPRRPGTQICAYNCRGFGALATFVWFADRPCPPSFDGLFPGP